MTKIKACKYGRGVFAERDIEAGEEIFTDNLLLLSEDDNGPTLRRYEFGFDDDKAGIALGKSSLLNHSKTPNADYAPFDINGHPIIKVWAIKKIKEGQQIFIDYGYNPNTLIKKQKQVEIDLQLPLHIIQIIKKVADQVNLSTSQVLNVVLAFGMERDKNGSANKRKN